MGQCGTGLYFNQKPPGLAFNSSPFNPLHLYQTWKKHFLVNSEILGIHIRRKKTHKSQKIEIATNCVNQIFNLNSIIFFLFTGATWYYHTIYFVFTYFASFTDYEDDIFEVIQIFPSLIPIDYYFVQMKFKHQLKNKKFFVLLFLIPWLTVVMPLTKFFVNVNYYNKKKTSYPF